MVPRARTAQCWPLRPWRSQRKMYVVIYRGALRRRIRRLVRSRLFNNVRTATRNLDLPLAIATPPTGSSALCRDRNDSGSVWRQQGGPFFGLILMFGKSFEIFLGERPRGGSLVAELLTNEVVFRAFGNP